MTESGSRNRNGTRASARRPGRWLARVLLLALVALIVVALGAVVVSNTRPQPHRDATAKARDSALDDSATLDGELQRARSGEADNDAVRAALAGAADTVRAGVEGLGTRTGQHTASGGTPSGDTGNTSALVTELNDQAQSNLKRAADVDPGLARLLASLAAGELWHSVDVATAAGITSPASGKLAAARTSVPATADPSCGAGSSASSAAEATGSATWRTPAPEGSKPDGAAALSNAAMAEQRAVYSYIAALPKLHDGGQHQVASDQLASHQQALLAAEGRLRSLCVRPPLRQPGFDLGSDFGADPYAFLGRTELDAAASYSTLIGLSGSLPTQEDRQDREVRQLAIDGLLRSVANAQQLGTDVPALPGYQD